MEIILKLQNSISGSIAYFHDIEKNDMLHFKKRKYIKKLKIKILIEFYKIYFLNPKQDLYVKKLLELFELKNILKIILKNRDLNHIWSLQNRGFI